MAKFIAHAPNGQAYQCDSLAEVKQVEGGFKFRKAKKRRNPSLEAGWHKRLADQDYEEAMRNLSGGDATDDKLLASIYYGRAIASGALSTREAGYLDDHALARRGAGALGKAQRKVEALAQGKDPRKVQNPRKKRNGGCGCAGACGNPHCGPKKRNGKRPADQYQFAAWQEKAKGMTDAQLLYVIKDAREAAKAMRGHDPVSEGWYEDEANTMAQELYRRRQGKRRNPAGQGEDYNMAAFAGAVEHGLLPPKNATPDYKKGYAEGARIAKQNKLAVAAALGAFRSTKSQAKAGELLREMAGTASTSTPIGNPRKKRNPVGADPRYVPVGNPKPKGKYLAHEKEEEQIFASMLSKLPVGVTMKAGKFRVRKLSKGFVVVDGERLSMKDAAAKLHGR